MDALLLPTSLVLVAVMNAPRDLEIARLLGWYRIPLRSAPKVIAVDFLAFYQTAAFGEDKWRIQYFAPVRGHELTTRQELLRDEPDHPNAHHEYYKIQIGDLQRLPKPVLAGEWRRITFLYTTGEYLLNANTVNDLVVANHQRPMLWQALRERLGSQPPYGQQQTGAGSLTEELDLRPEVLAALFGLREDKGDYRENG
jgi:hypothetical protein